MMEISCQFHYDSAHFLTEVPEGHKCGRMHGHTYLLTATVRGDIGLDGWVTDFADVAAIIEPVISQLDHHLINDVIPNPTVENQLLWLWKHIDVPGLHRLTLREGMTNEATHEGRTP